jgi:isopenicillin N synthase-like dioxygenase
VASETFVEIPIIGLGGIACSTQDRIALAEHLRYVCHEIGFFVMVDHGVSNQLVADVFDTMERFFALPDTTKALIDKRQSRHFRGWEPVGTEFTNNRPDIRQQIDLWSEWPAAAPDAEPAYLRLLGPNQWLPDDLLSGHRALLRRWFDELGALADRLLGLLSLGLGLDDDHLARYFGDRPMSLTKLISYPPTPAGQAGVNAHHDTGFVTLLAAGTTPGLQVENPHGDWIDVPVVADSFVVNLGEMLQGITGNYFVATPHRVITDRPRLSAGYFHGPSLETRLDPLPLGPEFAAAVAASPRHAAAGFMAQRDETEAGVGDMQSAHRPNTYGEQLWNYFARSYPANMALHYP